MNICMDFEYITWEVHRENNPPQDLSTQLHYANAHVIQMEHRND